MGISIYVDIYVTKNSKSIQSFFIDLGVLKLKATQGLNIKAMRSVSIIEYSIKNRVETNISQKFSSDFHAIISVNSNFTAGVPFRKFKKVTKIIVKISNENVKKHCMT